MSVASLSPGQRKGHSGAGGEKWFVPAESGRRVGRVGDRLVRVIVVETRRGSISRGSLLVFGQRVTVASPGRERRKSNPFLVFGTHEMGVKVVWCRQDSSSPVRQRGHSVAGGTSGGPARGTESGCWVGGVGAG